jgi:hypothetical protein
MPVTLYRGDVVFTADAHGTLMHTVISTAQRLGAPLSDGRASSVHVAIATGNNLEVVEAVGAGLKRRPIHDGRYRVYHYVGEKGPLVRDCAAQVAESHFDQQSPDTNFGRYNKGLAALSPFRLKSRAQNANTQQFGAGAHCSSSFFCSNFVWRCYMAAGEAAHLGQLPVENSHSQLSPRDLETILRLSNMWEAQDDGHAMTNP